MGASTTTGGSSAADGVLSPEVEDAVRGAVREAVGAAPDFLDVLAAEPGRAVVRVTGANLPDPLVVKVAAPSPARGRGADLEATAAAMALAAAAGVPVPEVLGARSAGPRQDVGYLVQRSVDGTPWRELRPRLGEDEVRSVHRRLAEVVLALQSVRPAGFGDLDAAGRPAGDDLRTALHRRTDRLVADPADRAEVHALLDREPDVLDGAGATLCHDDLHAENVLLARGGGGWRVTAVLDWDKAWAGPAESDVARLAFWDGMTGPGFWQVYRAAVPEAPGWPRRALLHQLLWCLEYDVGTDRHRADTAAVRAALGSG
jgi:aminoglycoside phosphotransferase (APT) family kinase protein